MVLIVDGRQGGFSGDIFLSALTDLLDVHTEVNEVLKMILKHFNSEKNDFRVEKTSVDTFHGSHLVQNIVTDVEEHLHGNELVLELEECGRAIRLSESAILLAKKIFTTILVAEGTIHGSKKSDFSDIHLHELNSIDTFIDVLGVSYLLTHPKIQGEQILGLPVRAGTGWMTFSHGKVQVPPPAVLEILKTYNYPYFEGDIAMEFLTPTGAAILVNCVEHIKESLPSISLSAVGMGFGCKKVENFVNYSRILRGTLSVSMPSEVLHTLETHVDDVPGEILGAIFDSCFKNGALDVALYPLIMKKNRPGHCVRVLCREENVHALMKCLIRELGTLGVRDYVSNRHYIPRRHSTKKIAINQQEFTVAVKISEFDDFSITKAEFDDLRMIAEKTGKSIREIALMLE